MTLGIRWLKKCPLVSNSCSRNSRRSIQLKDVTRKKGFGFTKIIIRMTFIRSVLVTVLTIHLCHAGERSNSLVTFLEESTKSVLAEAEHALASLSVDDATTGLHGIDGADVIDFNMELTDVAITGLSTFKLLDVQYDEAGGSVRIRLEFFNLRIKGKYSLNGTVLDILPLFGSGGFQVTCKDFIVTLNGSIPLGIKSPQIQNQKVYLYDQTYTANFDSFLGGGLVLGMVTGKVTPLLGKMVFDVYRNDLHDQLSHFFTTSYNKQLLNYSP